MTIIVPVGKALCMSHPTPLRTRDCTILFLAIFAALTRAPHNMDTVLGRRELVLKMLRRGDTATLSDDTLAALSGELLAIATRFPTIDVLLALYDEAVIIAKNITVGLDMAMAGEVQGLPFLARHVTPRWFDVNLEAM